MLRAAPNNEAIRQRLDDASAYLRYTSQLRRSIQRGPGGRLDTFWLVRGSRFLGEIQLRHRPSGRYPQIKSHIYYEIRPSERGKGYGHLLLELGLRKARAIGLRNVRLSVNMQNAASRRIIETGGGRLLGEYALPDGSRAALYRIRIPTTQPVPKERAKSRSRCANEQG